MIVFAIIGVVLVTLAFAYVAFVLFLYGFFCLIGFDEFLPLQGAGLWLGSAATCAIWYWLVGQHIGLNITVR
jgi:hypothetical protein